MLEHYAESGEILRELAEVAEEVLFCVEDRDVLRKPQEKRVGFAISVSVSPFWVVEDSEDPAPCRRRLEPRRAGSAPSRTFPSPRIQGNTLRTTRYRRMSWSSRHEDTI